jgi:hypothetical protein
MHPIIIDRNILKARGLQGIVNRLSGNYLAIATLIYMVGARDWLGLQGTMKCCWKDTPLDSSLPQSCG